MICRASLDGGAGDCKVGQATQISGHNVPKRSRERAISKIENIQRCHVAFGKRGYASEPPTNRPIRSWKDEKLSCLTTCPAKTMLSLGQSVPVRHCVPKGSPHSLSSPDTVSNFLPLLARPACPLPEMERVRVLQNEVWPADEPSSHYVGAAPVSTSRITTSNIPSSRKLKRVESLHTTTTCVRASRRSITSIQDAQKGVLQGFCRMSWFAGLRCTRFLRLNGRSLECFDSSIRKRLWVAVLDGARVRIAMPNRKIILSKLPVGVVEFYVADEKMCRLWSAALLRASTLASRQQEDDFF